MKLLLGQSNEVVINGQKFTGRSVSIIGDEVKIDDKSVDVVIHDENQYNLQVFGNIDKLEVNKGDVNALNVKHLHLVKGSVHALDVGQLSTVDGNVVCRDVSGSVKTTSGTIEARSILGGIKTISGMIVNTIKDGKN